MMYDIFDKPRIPFFILVGSMKTRKTKWHANKGEQDDDIQISQSTFFVMIS